MLASYKLIEKRDISVNPKDIEVDFISEGLRGTRIVLSSKEWTINPYSLQHKTEISKQFVATGNYADNFKNEISRLLETYDENKNSTTYLLSIAELYSLCGENETAIKYAKEASEISKEHYVLERLGEFLFLSGNIEDARRIFNNLANEDSIYSILRLTQIEIESGNKDKAIKLINKALEIDFVNWRSQLIAGTLHLINNEFEQAIRSFRVALEDKHNSASLYTNIGIAYYLLGMPKKSIRELRKAIAINNANTSALVLLADTCSDVNYSLNNVKDHIETRLYDDPKNKALIERLGKIYLDLNEIGKGIELLKYATNNINDPTSWNNLGVLWSNRNQTAAIPYYWKAVEIAGGISNVFSDRGAEIAVSNLVTALLHEKNYYEVINHCQKYISNSPDKRYLSVDPLYKIAEALFAAYISIEKIEDAITLGIKFLSESTIKPELKISICTFFTTYYSIGKTENELNLAYEYAKRAYDTLNEIDSDNNSLTNLVTNNLAFIQAELGKYDEAQTLLANINPYSEHQNIIKATRGLIALRKGNIEKGSDLYNQAISNIEDFILKDAVRRKFYLELAKYWLNKGEKTRGFRYLKKILKTKIRGEHWRVDHIQAEASELHNKS